MVKGSRLIRFGVAAIVAASLGHLTCLDAATVGLWTLNEGQGSVFADSSGNANDAQITWGGGAWSSDSPFEPDVFNSSYDFPEDVRVPDDVVLNFSGAFTVECWVKFITLAGNPYLVSKRGVGSSTGYWIEFDAGSNQFVFLTGDGVGLSSTTATIGAGPYVALTMQAGVWYHVAGVYTGTLANGGTDEMIIYINGISNGGNGSTGAAANADDLNFGSFNRSDKFGDILLDDVRLSDVALAPADLGFHGVLGRATSPADTLALWLFDDSGFIADPNFRPVRITDSSGSNLHRTVNWWGASEWSVDSPWDIVPDDPENPADWTPAKNNSFHFGPAEVIPEDPNDDAFNMTGAFTVEFWVNFESFNGDPYLMSKRNTTFPPSGWWFEFFNMNTFAFFVVNQNTYSGKNTEARLGQGPYASLPAEIGRWYHVAGIYTGPVSEGGTGEICLYINGISNGCNGSAGLVGNDDKLTLGSFNLSDHFFAGFLDEVRVSNAALPVDLLGWNQSIIDAADCSEALAYGFGSNADLTSDCRIHLPDFSNLASHWLEAGDIPANIDGVGLVDVSDVGELAAVWLQCMDPVLEQCEHSWRWWE